MTSRSAFWLLIFLAASVLGATGMLLGYLGFPGEHATVVSVADACASMLQQLASSGRHIATQSEKALVLVLSSMALAGVSSAIHMAWATRSILNRLSNQRLPPPLELDKLVKGLGLEGRVVFCASPELFSYCVGCLKPMIHISAGMVEALDEDALRAVLVHEAHHLRHRDPLRIAIATVLAAASFPFPLASALRRSHILSREIEADRAAVNLVGRKPLARALLTTMRHPRALILNSNAAIGAFEPRACRVAHLTAPEAAVVPRLARKTLATSLLSFSLLAMLAAFAVRHPVHARANISVWESASFSHAECPIGGKSCKIECVPVGHHAQVGATRRVQPLPCMTAARDQTREARSLTHGLE